MERISDETSLFQELCAYNLIPVGDAPSIIFAPSIEHHRGGYFDPKFVYDI